MRTGGQSPTVAPIVLLAWLPTIAGIPHTEAYLMARPRMLVLMLLILGCVLACGESRRRGGSPVVDVTDGDKDKKDAPAKDKEAKKPEGKKQKKEEREDDEKTIF